MNNNQTDYAAVEHLLDKEAWRFVYLYGGDFDDVRQEASLAYCKALKTFQPELGNRFSTWLVHQVRGRLKNAFLNTRWARHHIGCETDRDWDSEFARREFDLDGFVDGLSNDAADVVRLAVVVKRRGGVRSKRRAVVEFLKDLGWAGARIAESVLEIKEALQS